MTQMRGSGSGFSYTASTSSVSWKKALLHAGIVLVLAMISGLALLALLPDADPERLGEAVGAASVLLALMAFAISLGIQSGKFWLTVAAVGAVVVLVVVGAAGYLLVKLGRSLSGAPLTAEERARPQILEAASGPRFCHDALAFYMPSPGDGFQPAPEVEKNVVAAQGEERSYALAAWVYDHELTGERVMIQVAKGFGHEWAFRAFVDGMKGEIVKHPGISLVSDRLQWSDGIGEYRLNADVDGGVYLFLRCLGGSGGRGPVGGRVICAQTVTRERGDLAWVPEGLRLGDCPDAGAG